MHRVTVDFESFHCALETPVAGCSDAYGQDSASVGQSSIYCIFHCVYSFNALNETLQCFENKGKNQYIKNCGHDISC